ncbi:hypothetical protein C0993_003251, partial [Termitomyces sp. T159_Od127]
TTASESALIAIVAARSLYRRSHPDIPPTRLVIYTTSQTHSLGVKAGLVLDLSVRVLEVKAEDNFSLRGETLQFALEEDERRGMKPLVLNAAWAGVALACPEYREKCHLKTINEIANSFCTNFHKWGLTNLDASTLWVRNRKHLTDAMEVTPPYLRTTQGTVIDYRNWHLGLSRRFRSLKLWFVFRSFGVQGFRSYIRKVVILDLLVVRPD